MKSERPTSWWLSNLPAPHRSLVQANIQDGESVRFYIQTGGGIAGIQGLVALDDRILVVKTGMGSTGTFAGAFARGTISSYHYRDITGVQVTQHLVGGFIELVLPGGPKCQGSIGVPEETSAWRLPNCIPLNQTTVKVFSDNIVALQQLVANAKR